jgi:nucleotide-binding universal stress UspA family protein
LKGNAEVLITKLAREKAIDLIIMGTMSRSVAGLLIGSSAENVLHQVNCSVLTVKPDGFVTPVRLNE